MTSVFNAFTSAWSTSIYDKSTVSIQTNKENHNTKHTCILASVRAFSAAAAFTLASRTMAWASFWSWKRTRWNKSNFEWIGVIQQTGDDTQHIYQLDERSKSINFPLQLSNTNTEFSGHCSPHNQPNNQVTKIFDKLMAQLTLIIAVKPQRLSLNHTFRPGRVKDKATWTFTHSRTHLSGFFRKY